jgi:hypothetical protein
MNKASWHYLKRMSIVSNQIPNATTWILEISRCIRGKYATYQGLKRCAPINPSTGMGLTDLPPGSVCHSLLHMQWHGVFSIIARLHHDYEVPIILSFFGDLDDVISLVRNDVRSLYLLPRQR